MDTKIEKLKEIIKREGIITKNQRKIAGAKGNEISWLFDLRNIFLNSEGLDLITDIFWQYFEKEYPFQVGGQEVAAIPLISAIILKSEQINRPVNGFIIRKSRKPTGLQKI
ncbi:MAG: quinonprotein alcohol dehydrogenase, partial [Candidatus Parcubacteria bacterium]|nr:quinonprotein alcohol dehydrogenase [Candidatus Parcubacteria bacterium]